MEGFGSFSFGFVIGWYIYFINRHRKSEVQLSDLATLVGVIGGAAVTAYIEKAGNVFGWYGFGLATGFLTYFLILVWLVHKSPSEFDWAWFIDGRRKKLDIGKYEPAPDGTRPAFSLHRNNRAVALSTNPKNEGEEQRRHALQACNEAVGALQERIGSAADDGERVRLLAEQGHLTKEVDRLLGLYLHDVNDSEEVRRALISLKGITSELRNEAARMRQAADIIAAAANVIRGAGRVFGTLSGIFV